MGEPLKQSQETATLVKRLAGPSSGKAGLAKDQTEINRIIAEVSKGSKFYENEKKKDKELTERINKILKIRDDAIRGVDISKIERGVDHLLDQLEAQRDLTQIIVHVDMDAFYANVELLDNPDLKGKPFAVGHGVLTTASYEARKYGVRSGMAGFVAKKLCPDLVFVRNNFSKYSEMSDKVMAIFRHYDPTMQPAGCDEGYLNITAYCEEHAITAEDCVQGMRKKVYEDTRLTVSAGIAPNKMLAKICSDKNKPDGQYQMTFDRKSIITFMHDLPIRKVPGIGRVHERLLESVGIKSCGDIFNHRAIISLMDKQFGLTFLLRTYLGIASNNVQPHQREERKSIGAERTFGTLGDEGKILRKLEEVAVELESDMETNGWAGRTVTLKYKLATYQVFTRAKSFDRWITSKEDLYATGKELLLPELPLQLRLIGLRVTKLKDLRSDSTSGIKRFFDSVKDEQLNKRRKVNIDGDYHNLGDQVDPVLVDIDEYEDAMPGFHEHEEVESTIPDIDPDEEVAPEINVQTTTRPRPPVSEPNRPSKTDDSSASASSSAYKIKRRPRSTSEAIKSKVDPSPVESHVCPICAKILETDNKGLNAHVDFCLSRSAIREAQAEASSPVKKSTKKTERPTSKRDGNKFNDLQSWTKGKGRTS